MKIKKLKIHEHFAVKRRNRCSVCNYKIRGTNHESGQHHQMAIHKKQRKG